LPRLSGRATRRARLFTAAFRFVASAARRVGRQCASPPSTCRGTSSRARRRPVLLQLRLFTAKCRRLFRHAANDLRLLSVSRLVPPRITKPSYAPQPGSRPRGGDRPRPSQASIEALARASAPAARPGGTPWTRICGRGYQQASVVVCPSRMKARTHRDRGRNLASTPVVASDIAPHRRVPRRRAALFRAR